MGSIQAIYGNDHLLRRGSDDNLVLVLLIFDIVSIRQECVEIPDQVWVGTEESNDPLDDFSRIDTVKSEYDVRKGVAKGRTAVL